MTQDQDATDPGLTITPAMSEKSRKKAEQDAFDNAQKVVDEINAETEKPEPADGS